MTMIRELHEQETHLAYPFFPELLPDFALTEEEFVRQINQHMRPEGFRLIGSFEDGMDTPAAIAGFRAMHTIGRDYFLYIDDLVTHEAYRGRGHATRLMAWLCEEGRRLGCTQLHLDSDVGPHRYDAHRFYHKKGMQILCYHFWRDL